MDEDKKIDRNPSEHDLDEGIYNVVEEGFPKYRKFRVREIEIEHVTSELRDDPKHCIL